MKSNIKGLKSTSVNTQNCIDVNACGAERRRNIIQYTKLTDFNRFSCVI